MAAEKNNKTLNVPNLRFPEFSGEWEKCTLGSIGETFNGLTGKSAADFGSGSPYITYKSIFDNSKIDISKVEYVKITETERVKQTQNEVEYGDIFFTTSSETPEEVGMASVLLSEIRDCYLNSFCFGYRLFDKCIHQPDFFRFYLRSSNLRKKIAILAQGSTRFNISKNEVMKMPIFLPSLAEQRKISKILSLIEDRIETQKKIIEDLKKLKRAICKIVFSSPECVTRKMADMATITMGQSPSSLSYNEDRQGLPLIQGNLDLYDGQIRPRIYTSEITQTCTKGDVILTVRAPVGEIAHAQLAACIGRGVCAISPHNSSDAELIYQYLSYYKPTWAKLEQGSTFSSINGADIRGIEVRCPSMSKIMLLQLFDTRIQESINLLNAYSVSKCYLLSQLFI